jgi:hypothetical protein
MTTRRLRCAARLTIVFAIALGGLARGCSSDSDAPETANPSEIGDAPRAVAYYADPAVPIEVRDAGLETIMARAESLDDEGTGPLVDARRIRRRGRKRRPRRPARA